MSLHTNPVTDKLRQRNRELAILNSVAQALNSSLMLKEALHTTLAQVAQLFELETGWIWLLHEESGVGYLATAQNLPPGLTANSTAMQGSCYCLRLYDEDKLSGADNINVLQCSRLNWRVDGTNGLKFHASIPINAHGKKLGILNLASTDWRELSAEDLRLLNTIGAMLGIAIERTRLFERQHELGVARERNRLAREIHDTLAQGLVAVIMQLESAAAQLDQHTAQPFIHNALTLTRANLEEARRSVLNLRAAPLATRNLPQALRHLATNSDKIEVIYSQTGDEIEIDSHTSTGIYRLAQEAITNVIKHAEATQVQLSLDFGSESLT
ncbi:MAG TPA: GAF domain-containing protein, partial [Anaerolineae bacterium]|nr:GAF domain-containing protein [Anaerolineae bacterium]